MLQNQLINIRKGNSTILVYLYAIKTIVDSLATISEKVNESDLMVYILNGLGRAYDNFVISAQNRETSFTFVEIKPRSLSHEQWLTDKAQDISMTFDSQHPSAFYGRNVSNSDGGGKPKYKSNNQHTSNFKNNQYTSRSDSRASLNFKNSKFHAGSGSAPGNFDKSFGENGATRPHIEFSKFECQICRCFGHLRVDVITDMHLIRSEKAGV
ncbi:uncharacterized protein LOC113350755 [Papaver somniferum]|uniref:uncharacterized protein LOC113350755 n=1 Tax=Papaver somniferum TaxID=3469 RepID=UPI000E6F65B3|nr:uncharacterized protein LOC113350755 [Papaver somniferum]